MSMFVTLLAFAFQSSAPAPSQPVLRVETPAPVGLTPAHDLYFQDSNRLTPEIRAAVHRSAACVADRSPELATDVLNRDFQTRSYRAGLDVLARHNGDCFRRGSRMRPTSLVFAGAIAEKLLETSSQPVNVRLARAAQGPAAPFYSEADRTAMCVVRSVPDEVGRLFAADIDSDAETDAYRALDVPVRVCAPRGVQLNATPAGLRAILATAALRTVTGAPARTSEQQ